MIAENVSKINFGARPFLCEKFVSFFICVMFLLSQFFHLVTDLLLNHGISSCRCNSKAFPINA